MSPEEKKSHQALEQSVENALSAKYSDRQAAISARNAKSDFRRRLLISGAIALPVIGLQVLFSAIGPRGFSWPCWILLLVVMLFRTPGLRRSYREAQQVAGSATRLRYNAAGSRSRAATAYEQSQFPITTELRARLDELNL